MVVTVVWMQSLTVVIISSCVLLIIGALLVCCVCWDTKRSSLGHFYMLNENTLKEVRAPAIGNNSDYEKGNGLFRHLSTGSIKTNKNIWTTSFPSKISSTCERGSYPLRSDSTEIVDAFSKSVLRLEGNTDNNDPLASAIYNGDKEEDICSCISSDSKRTFYSTYHWARTASVADTFCSTLSQSELNNCVK